MVHYLTSPQSSPDIHLSNCLFKSSTELSQRHLTFKSLFMPAHKQDSFPSPSPAVNEKSILAGTQTEHRGTLLDSASLFLYPASSPVSCTLETLWRLQPALTVTCLLGDGLAPRLFLWGCLCPSISQPHPILARLRAAARGILLAVQPRPITPGLQTGQLFRASRRHRPSPPTPCRFPECPSSICPQADKAWASSLGRGWR